MGLSRVICRWLVWRGPGILSPCVLREELKVLPSLGLRKPCALEDTLFACLSSSLSIPWPRGSGRVCTAKVDDAGPFSVLIRSVTGSRDMVGHRCMHAHIPTHVQTHTEEGHMKKGNITKKPFSIWTTWNQHEKKKPCLTHGIEGRCHVNDLGRVLGHVVWHVDPLMFL